ncbi:MBL fold metallo-hydrolase [Dactylosporangium sp. NBC_01737]|uniref:MBL fold metallo-hydrolase n=1 Tax=Dactylosporangium sp. NBC_01737 TaxID=2975959 RepID=UPI002E1024AA|nr:MBL fold metallo-hydrolase [Dactylosporangium sp. NBC_01737]
MTTGWQIGDARITPIVEIVADCVIQAGMRDATPSRLLGIPWLRPDFATDAGEMKSVVQAFLIELGDTTVLVDTGVGNGKHRPGLPAWSGLDTEFLQRLAAHGVKPGDVDVVVSTHLHFDHVGWNTTALADGWTPTFTRARHLVTETEFGYWATLPQRETADDRAGFEDSVRPVLDAGLVDLVPDDHELRDGVRLVPTPGHTPGHVSVSVESAGRRAIISGDAIHHPCQIAHPEWNVHADFDPDLARRTRVELLGRCADSGSLLIGSHFPSPTAVLIARNGRGFTVQ